jgi:hypothetical protein
MVGEARDDNVLWRMRFVYWKTKATLLIAFPQQQRLR